MSSSSKFTFAQLKKLKQKRDILRKEVEVLKKEYKSMFKALAHKESELRTIKRESIIATSEASKATKSMKKEGSLLSKKKKELHKREKQVKSRERLLTSIDRAIEKQKDKLSNILIKRADLEPRVKELENIIAQSEGIKQEMHELSKREAKAQKTIQEAKGKERQVKAYTLLLDKCSKDTGNLKRNIDNLSKLEAEWKTKVANLRKEARKIRISPQEIEYLKTLKRDAEKSKNWLREKKGILKKTAEVVLAETKRIGELQHKKNVLSEKVAELSKAAKSMKKIEVKLRQFKKEKKEADKLAIIRKDSERTLSKSQKMLSSLSKEIDEKSNMLNLLQKKEADLRKGIKILDKIDVAKELKKLAAVKREYEATSKRAEILDKACKTLTHEKNNKAKEIHRHLAALEDLTKRVNEKAATLADLKKQESTLKDSVQKMKTAIGRSKVRKALLELQKKIDESQKKYDKVRKQASEIEQTEQKSRQQLNANMAVLKKLTKEITNRETQIHKLSDKEDDLKKLISLLNKEIAAKKETKTDKTLREKKESLMKIQKEVQLNANKFEKLKNDASKRIALASEKERELLILERKIRSSAKFAKIKNFEAEEEKAKKELENTKRTLFELKTELTETKKDLGQAKILIKALPSKKKEYEQLDMTVKKLVLLKDCMVKEVNKKEQRVATGAKLIEDLEANLELKRSRLDDVAKVLSVTTKDKSALSKMVKFSKDELKKTNDELAKYKQALGDLRQKRSDLKQIIETIARREKAVSIKEDNLIALEKAVSSKQAEVVDLDTAKQNAMAVLAEKRKVFEEIKKGLERRRKDIAELHESTKISHEAERKALSASREAEQGVKEFEKKQNQFSKQDLVLASKINELREAEEILKRERVDFEKQVHEHKSTMMTAESEWKDKISALEHYRNDISAQGRQVEGILKSDLGVLKSKEKEVIDIVSGIEEDKKRLEGDERAIIKQVSALEKERERVDKSKAKHDKAYDKLVTQERVMKETAKYIEKEKQNLERENMKINKAKELKKVLPSLEKRFRMLTGELKKLEPQFIKKTIAAERKEFKQQEKQLSLEREDFEDSSFRDYIHREITVKEPVRESREDIHAIVREAKQCIDRGDVDTASRMADEINSLVGKIADKDEKRMLEYELRDLKTSIKLAQLA
jgi:chromosome segregation ATPase